MPGSAAGSLVHCRAGGPALQGLIEFDVVLHHPDEHPRGALCPARALFACGHARGGGAESQLWLWLHPAAYAEALAALRVACAASAVDIAPRCAPVTAAELLLMHAPTCSCLATVQCLHL